MINLATITAAMESLLTSQSALSGYTIERSALVNDVTGRLPWVGIYRGDIAYAPRTLGSASVSWKAILTLHIRVQNIGETEADAEDKLEASLAAVLAAIQTDRTIGGTVTMTTGYKVDYFSGPGAESSLYWQMADVTVTCEARTA